MKSINLKDKLKQGLTEEKATNNEQVAPKEEVSEMIFWSTMARGGLFPSHINNQSVHIKLDTAYKNIIARPIENPFLPTESKNGVVLPGKSTHKDEQSGKEIKDEQLIQTAIIIATGKDVSKSIKKGMCIQYYARSARPVPFDFYGFETTSEANILAIYTIATE